MFDKGGSIMVIQMEMDLKRKLEILSDGAKYDVACTSSGVEQRGKGICGKYFVWRHLSQLFCRWTVYFPFKDPVYQSMYL